MAKPEKENLDEHDEFAEKNAAAAALSIKSQAPALEENLPPEVRDNLIGYGEIELENQLYDCLVSLSPGNVTVDKILMAMWHRHKKAADRAKALRMLNAMATNGRIVKSHSQRGFTIPTTVR